MKETIIRLRSINENAEVLEKSIAGECFRSVDIPELLECIKNFNGNGNARRSKITMFSDQIIGHSSTSVLIKQAERKKIVTFNKKSYKINFPNAIYIMDFNGDRISDVEAYCYKEYCGENTELFEYAMPNMLYGNRICMGTADKKIVANDYVSALERLIFTQYTHAKPNGIKGFSSTEAYFKHLEKKTFPYDLLIPIDKTLEDVI